MKRKAKKVKALLLFSGGLDSILAAKILADLGIEVTALTFVSYFFDAGQAKKSARENDIDLKVVDFSGKHFGIVKNPCYGYGAGMNPCIDCHLLMLKEVKKIAAREKYDIIATGEVLGQRPMSQNREALKLIEKESKLTGKILRPLSAKVLPETEMEKLGLVDRKKLCAISGRGRKEQITLAKKFGVENYPSPAGGCILTDKEYSKKLQELLKNIKSVKSSDIKLLRIGRHFWIYPVRSFINKGSKNKTSGINWKSRASDGGGTKIILGRNHEENLALKKIAEKGDILLELKDIPGPLALIRGRDKIKATEIAKEKLIKYAKKLKDKKPAFRFL